MVKVVSVMEDRESRGRIYQFFLVGIFLFLSIRAGCADGLYCLEDFSGERCHFADLAACQKALGEQGACVLNPHGMVPPSGGAPFCVVENWRTECIYLDQASCEVQALARKADCIGNPNMSFQSSVSYDWVQPAKDRYLSSPSYAPVPGLR
ncbi:MAG: hypothetical protein H7832_08515 [Magnetococcus sp. DMHC-6]